uniref:hypothetical protein n=1 Tax=uncultured Draconibacterium sp. TaxID=1573823 RepID=UPI003217F1A4
MPNEKVKAPTKAEIKADAEALAAKIKSVPDYDKDANLLYAVREVGNAVDWLSK